MINGVKGRNSNCILVIMITLLTVTKHNVVERGRDRELGELALFCGTQEDP
jgi:hypothetical protein